MGCGRGSGSGDHARVPRLPGKVSRNAAPPPPTSRVLWPATQSSPPPRVPQPTFPRRPCHLGVPRASHPLADLGRWWQLLSMRGAFKAHSLSLNPRSRMCVRVF